MYKKSICKNIFLLCCVVLFFGACSASKSPEVASKRVYQTPEQELFNVVKRLFDAEGSGEFVVDTSWDRLTINKREQLFYPFSIEIENIYYEISAKPLNEHEIEYSLSISSQLEESKKEYLDERERAHEIFWNRVESALGLEQWRECSVDEKTIESYSNYFTKATQKESLLCDVKIEASKEP